MILKDVDTAVRIMAFHEMTGSIDFLGVHPQYRKKGIVKAFCEKALHELVCSEVITVTTFREGDKADTGHRETIKSLGFAEVELLVEFGYPTQKFILQKPKGGFCNQVIQKPHGSFSSQVLRKRKRRAWSMNEIQAEENPLLQDFIIKSLFQFAFPTIVMILLMGLYTIVDTIFVARFAGTNALSALNIVCPVINLIVGFGTMLATGGSAIVARKMGRGKP